MSGSVQLGKTPFMLPGLEKIINKKGDNPSDFNDLPTYLSVLTSESNAVSTRLANYRQNLVCKFSSEAYHF